MYPKKRLGQRFLIDKNIVRKILSVASVEKGDLVLEIGPGLGILTEALLDKGASVVAVEVDRVLCGKLEERFSGVGNFELIAGDALKKDFVGLSRRVGRKFKVVSNLPYNISGPVIVKFFDEREAFSGLTLMLQKEVARRLAALPSTKDYGILSVFAQVYCDVRCAFDVSPNSFRPRPKVVSTVVTMRMLEHPLVDRDKEGFFRRVVKAAFSKRRKVITNALTGKGGIGMDAATVTEALLLSGIDPKSRGETVSPQGFVSLAGCLLRLRGRRPGESR